ncbi:PspC domain-containing protein [Arthrobacter echini]|uniref:PspC domain-containing protein n=1 Tax=Arthrobacter echini TaxID=1529066 RepID=A0A4V3Z5Q2_9MICC|nr:ATP-binding protein [Arthrobacter echini]THJ66449.1 PspC domain-containing protein [Arthrobacter echini]
MRPPLVRRPDGVIAGVCTGLAVHLGISPAWVRIAMVVLTLASGAGVVLYGWLWIFVPTTADRVDLGRRSGPASFMRDVDGVGAPGAGPDGGTAGAAMVGALDDAAGSAPAPGQTQTWADRARRAGRREILFGAGLLIAAAALLAQLLGVEADWGFLLPVSVVVIGAALAWSQLDEARRARVMSQAHGAKGGWGFRLLAGIVLVVAGVLVALSSSNSLSLTMTTLVAVIAVLTGVGLVLAPWGLKFWRDLETERASRVRETERAEIAAHLHDSVLQTLALIQNRADSEADVLRLARAQERELRQWLFADPTRDPGSLAERLRVTAGEIEDLYGHPVAVVAVGDALLGPGEDALAQAAREAMLNAAKHAHVAVSVYLEARADSIDVFVRDRGAGFDPDRVPADRAGIRESIHSRMQRNAGSADLRTGPDGTEVHLRLPRTSGNDLPDKASGLAGSRKDTG